jgi:hypothetical protein
LHAVTALALAGGVDEALVPVELGVAVELAPVLLVEGLAAELDPV